MAVRFREDLRIGEYSSFRQARQLEVAGWCKRGVGIREAKGLGQSGNGEMSYTDRERLSVFGSSDCNTGFLPATMPSTRCRIGSLNSEWVRIYSLLLRMASKTLSATVSGGIPASTMLRNRSHAA